MVTARRNRNDHRLTISLDAKPEKTQEGFLVIPVIIARKMVLDYPEFGRRELMGDDVFSGVFLKSCDGCPLVLEHPPEDVAPDNFDKYLVGVLLDPQIEREANRVVGKVKIYDPEVIRAVEEKEIVELSQGYACQIDETAGEFEGQRFDVVQTNMIMNHLAIVENGRAGNFVKMLYNNSRPSFGAADLERITRRRANMKLNAFKTLATEQQNAILKRLNVSPEAFRRLNEDEQAKKLENEADIPPEAEKENEGMTLEEKMNALEAKVNEQGQLLNAIKNTIDKMANGDHQEPDGDEAPANKPSLTNGDDEKKIENKVNAMLAKNLPARVNAYLSEAETTYVKARALVGSSAEVIAQRCNGVLPEFRKQVLIEHGAKSRDEVARMNAHQVEAYFDILASEAKHAINEPRANSHINHNGDRKATSHGAF